MKIEIEKPIIPRFVADWIESLYDEGGSKYDAIVIMFEYSVIKDKSVRDWFVDNKDTFITAVMCGYEIEQEPLYYAKIKGWELIKREIDEVYWNLGDGDLFVSDNGELVTGEHHTKLTKQQWNELGINDVNADFEVVE